MDRIGLKSLGFLIKFVGFLIASWIVVHVASVFGFFVALAYPFWWLILPKTVPCFLCRVKKPGEYCPFCKRVVDDKLLRSPSSVRSVILNAILVALFSVVSLTAVVFEGYLIKTFVARGPEKSVSFVFPSKGQYRLYEVFPMKVEVAGIKDSINAIQADIGFDPDSLRVVDISTKGSFANIFVQKEIDNEYGYARISGGIPNPGYSGGGGVFATFYFEAILPGVSKIEFLPSSMVLANDGRGTNVLKELSNASYLILPDEVMPEEREEQVRLIGESEVLGASEQDDVQLKFFDEEKQAVLGEAFDREASEVSDSRNVFEAIAGFINCMDRLIVSFWKSLSSAVWEVF